MTAGGRVPDLRRLPRRFLVYAALLPFVILVAILLVKPYGLFGQTRIERV